MTTPEPDNLQTKVTEIIKPLIEGFAKQPPMLAYGGLVLITALLIYLAGGGLSNILLAVPIIVIFAYLILQLGMRWLDIMEKKADSPLGKPNLPQPEPPKPESSERTVEHNKDDVPAKEWERRYLQHLLALCQYPPSMALVDIKEAGIGGHKLALDRIFTTLNTTGLQSGQASTVLFKRDVLGKVEMGEPVLTTMSQAENNKLVILGAPGSGKSTLVNYLTLCLVGERLAGDHEVKNVVTQDHLRQYGWELSHLRLWPLRVILREYAARGLSQGQDIWSFIADDLGRPGVKLAGYIPFLIERLQDDGCILLLDGLDEVDKASEVRQALKNNIEMFARDYPKVRILVTSRPYAYGSGWELQGFNVTNLLPFSEEQIIFFVEQWYTVMGQQDLTLGEERAKAYSESLVRQIKQISNLREMAQHPLLLTMMVYIHRGREGGALPQRREELYRLCVILLLDLWRRSKMIPGRETQTLAEELGMDMERLQKALAEVAFIAHRDQPEQTQTADILGATLAGILYKHKSKLNVDFDDIIEYVRDRAGLLEDHGRNADDSDDVYRFPHRTFQEYLAAMHLLNAPDFPQEMVKLARGDANRWREAVLLAGAAALPAMRWALVEALYGNKALPVGEVAEVDWWGAFLAGQVVVENGMQLDPPRVHREKFMRLQGWHKAVVERGMLPPRDRALAGQVLAALGDDRPGVGVVTKDGWLIPDIVWGEEVPAGRYTIGGDKEAFQSFNKQEVQIAYPYHLSRYPITSAQFQCFIEAADWSDQRWWGDMPANEQAFRKPNFPYANHPRETVSWYQATAFCRWLSDKLGYEVELPHEYEWEVAARYPDSRFYAWGNAFDVDKANTVEGGVGQTTAVGLYPAGQNEVLNLYDLSGNVWEWCRNKYDNPADETVDQSGHRRVWRGGSWNYSDGSARAAYRNLSHPGFRNDIVGFRVVRVRRSPSQHDL